MHLAQMVVLVAIATMWLGGCMARMTQADSAPLPQADPRAPQDVRTPLPPPDKGAPVPAPGQAQAPAPASAPVQAQPRSPFPGFYFQIGTGWSWAKSAGMTNAHPEPNGSNCLLQTPSPHVCAGSLNHLGSSFVIGAGVGYRFPAGFRADVTYSNRSGYDLQGTSPSGVNFDPKTTANTVMVNGYFSVPYTIADKATPYIGGGIGRSKNKVNNINWTDPPGPDAESGQVPGGSKSSTAWQLTLGAEVRVAPNWILDIGYRYSDLGKLQTNAGPATAGESFNEDNFTTPLTGKLRTNEVLLNFRYEF